MIDQNKPVDVVKAVLGNVPANDFGIIANQSKLNVQLPDVKTAFENNKDVLGDMKFDEFEAFYNDRVVPYHAAAKNADLMANDNPQLHMRPSGTMFGNLGYSPLQFTPFSKIKATAEDPIQNFIGDKAIRDRDDIISERKGKFIDKNGEYQTLESFKGIFSGSVLVPKQDPMTGEIWYHETSVNDPVAGASMRSVFGATPLSRNMDIMRSVYNLIPETISAVGHLIESGTRVLTAGSADDSDSVIKWSRAIQNLGQYYKAGAIEDEFSGLTAYKISNGLAQLGEQALIAWATGGLSMAGSLGVKGTLEALSMSAGKKGIMSFNAAANDILLKTVGAAGTKAAFGTAQKVAMNSGLAIGAIQAAGAWKQQARNMGINENDAALMYFGMAAITTAVEAKIGPNRMITFWENEAAQKTTMKAVANTLYKTAKTDGFASVKEAMKANPKKFMSIGLNAFKNAMSENSEKLLKTRGGAALLGGIEEGVEEGVENMQYKSVEAMYDFIAPTIYQSLQRKGGVDLQTGNGLFGTNMDDILKNNTEDMLLGGIAGLLGGAVRGGTHLKNDAFNNMTVGLAMKGRDAAKEYRQEIADAVNEVKQGKANWISSIWMDDSDKAYSQGKTEMERATFNAGELNKLVDLAEGIYTDSGLEKLVEKTKDMPKSAVRDQLLGSLELIVKEASVALAHKYTRQQMIDELKASEDPDKATKIAAIENEMQTVQKKYSDLYDESTKTSPLFNAYYNDIKATFGDDVQLANAYKTIAQKPTPLGISPFIRMSMFDELAVRENQLIEKANKGIQESKKMASEKLSSFRDKMRGFDLKTAGGANKAIKEISDFFEDMKGFSVDENERDQFKQELRSVLKIDRAEGDTEENFFTSLDEHEFAKVDELTNGFGYLNAAKEMKPITAFDLFAINLKDGNGDYIGAQPELIDSYLEEAKTKKPALLNEEELNTLLSNINDFDIFADASSKVWSKYDEFERKNLTYKGHQHIPLTAEQAEAVKAKNAERKAVVNQLLLDYKKSAAGRVITMAKIQDADLRKRKDILQTVFSELKMDEQFAAIQDIVFPANIDETSINDLLKIDQKIQTLEQLLWDKNKIEDVKKALPEIHDSLLGDAVLYRYFEFDEIPIDDAWDYGIFKRAVNGTVSEKRIANTYFFNYFHTLLNVSPKEFNTVYLKTIGENDNQVTTYEQRQVIKTAYAHANHPDTSWMFPLLHKPGSFFDADFGTASTKMLTNAYLIRGLGRTGKSTRVAATVIKMMQEKAKITGPGTKPIRVLIIAPNSHLKEIHQQNVGASAQIDFKFNDEVNGNLDVSEYDAIMVDESSILLTDQFFNPATQDAGDFVQMAKAFRDKPIFFLGDDTQIVGRDSEGAAMTYVPASHFMLRSMPLSFKHATGNEDIYDVEEAVTKAIVPANKQIPLIKYPNTVYNAEQTIGVRQYNSLDKLIEDFVEQTTAYNGPNKVEDEFIFIVKDNAEASRVKAIVSSLGGNKELVRPIEYSTQRNSAQGGRWKRVYIGIAEDPSDGNNARSLNTSIGRSSGFIAMLGNGISRVGFPIDLQNVNPAQKAKELELLKSDEVMTNEMLKNITGDMSDIQMGSSPANKDVIKTLQELKGKVLSPKNQGDKYTVDGVEHERVHDIMESRHPEKKNRPYQKSSLAVGNFMDNISRRLEGVKTKESAKTIIAEELKNPVHLQTSTGNVDVKISLTEADIDALAEDIVNALNGGLNPLLNSKDSVFQAKFHGKIDNKPTAGTLDIAVVQNGKLTKVDVKAYKIKKNGLPHPDSVESWTEQMAIYEELAQQLQIPSNGLTYILGIPVDYNNKDIENGTINVSYKKGAIHLTPINDLVAKNTPAKQNSNTGQSTSVVTQAGPVTTNVSTETVQNGTAAEENPGNPYTQTEEEDSPEQSTEFGQRYNDNKELGQSRMYASTFYPVLPADESLDGSTSNLGEINDSEYNNFINKGFVQQARLMDIANKVKNQIQLSPREMEMFSDKTAEINKLIASGKPLVNKVSKESSLHAKLTNIAIREINSRMNAGTKIELRVVLEEDAAAIATTGNSSSINQQIALHNKYLGTNLKTLPAIFLSIDPYDISHYNIVTRMVEAYIAHTKVKLTRDEAIAEMDKKGMFKISRVYSFKEGAGMTAAPMYADLVQAFKNLRKSDGKFYVPVLFQTPGASVLKYGGNKTPLSEVLERINSAKATGAQWLGIKRVGNRFMASFTLTGDNPVDMEVNGKIWIEDGKVPQSAKDEINSFANIKKHGKEQMDWDRIKSSEFYDTMMQNRSFFITITTNPQTGEITLKPKPGKEKFFDFFGVYKDENGRDKGVGLKFKSVRNGTVSSKVLGRNADGQYYYPTAQEAKDTMNKFISVLEDHIANDTDDAGGFKSKLTTNFGIAKLSNKDLTIRPSDYEKIIVEGGDVMMPKMVVDMTPVIENKPQESSTSQQAVNDDQDSEQTDFGSIQFMQSFEKPGNTPVKSSPLIYSLNDVEQSISGLDIDDLEYYTNENGVFTVNEGKKNWRKLQETFGNDNVAIQRFMFSLMVAIRHSNPVGMNMNIPPIGNVDYSLNTAFEMARLFLRKNAGITTPLSEIKKMIKEGRGHEIAPVELRVHENIYGKIDLETGQFDNTGLRNLVSRYGFSYLTPEQQSDYIKYFSGTDEYYTAGVKMNFPWYQVKPDLLDKIVEVAKSDEDVDEEGSVTLKKSFSEYGDKANAATITDFVKTLFYSLGVTNKVKMNGVERTVMTPVPVSKLETAMLRIATDRYSTQVAGGIEDSDMNRFFTAMVNYLNNSYNSKDHDAVKALITVLGAPKEIRFQSEYEYEKFLEKVIKNKDMMPYYDVAYHSDAIKRVASKVILDPVKLEKFNAALDAKKVHAVQMINHFILYYRNVNVDRFTTAIFQNNGMFKMRNYDSMSSSDIENDMRRSLNAHVQKSRQGAHISYNARQKLAKMQLVTDGNRRSISLAGERPYLHIDTTKNGYEFTFEPGREREAVERLSILLNLNLERGFYDAFLGIRSNQLNVNAKKLNPEQVALNNQLRSAELAKMLGSMTVTLMDMNYQYLISEKEAQIKALVTTPEAGITDTAMKEAIKEENAKIVEQRGKLKEELKALKSSQKQTDEYVSSFIAANELVPSAVDISEIDEAEDTTEAPEESDTEQIPAPNFEELDLDVFSTNPANFNGYIKELAVVNSMTYSNNALTVGYNAAGKRQNPINWHSHLSNLIPSTKILSINAPYSTSFNNGHWAGLNNNAIADGTVIIHSPKLNVGGKSLNEATGKKFSNLNERELFQINLDAVIDSLANSRKLQVANIPIVKLGEGSYASMVDAETNGAIITPRMEQVTVKKYKDGKEVDVKEMRQVYHITNHAWETWSRITETIFANQNRLQQESINRTVTAVQNLINSYPKGEVPAVLYGFLETVNAVYESEQDAITAWLNAQAVILQSQNGKAIHDKLFANVHADMWLYKDYYKEKINGTEYLMPGNEYMKSNYTLAKKIFDNNRKIEELNSQNASDDEVETVVNKQRRLMKRLPFYNAYGQNKYQEGKKAIKNGTMTRQQVLEDVFNSELNEFINYAQSVNRVPKYRAQSSLLKDGKPVYRYQETIDGVKNVYYNPMYEAAFFHTLLINMSIGDQAFGNIGSYKNILDFFRRIKSAGSPGLSPNTSLEHPDNIPPKLKMLVVKDVHPNSEANRANGAIYMNPLTHIWLQRSLGGVNGMNGIIKGNIIKPLGFEVVNGATTMLKTAIFPVDAHSINESEESEFLLQKMIGPNLFKLYRGFVAEEKKNGADDVFSIQKALERTLDAVINDPNKYRSEMIDMIVPEDSIKEGIRGMVSVWPEAQTDPKFFNYTGIGADPALDERIIQEFDTKSLRIVQETTKKVGKNKVSFFSQLMESMASLPIETSNMREINEIRAKINNDFNEILYELAQNPEESQLYLKALGLSGSEITELDTYFVKLLRNKNITLDNPQLQGKLIEKLMNDVNSYGIKADVAGEELKLAPGFVVKRYPYNGGYLSYRGLKRLLEKGVITNDEFNAIRTQAEPLAMPKVENGSIQYGHMSAPFKFRKKFGIPLGADQSEVFGVILDGRYTDLRGLSIEKITTLIEGKESQGNWILEKFPDQNLHNIDASDFSKQEALKEEEFKKLNNEIRAKKIYDFLQLMKKLNTHFVLRTPSIISSGNWYENVEWPTYEFNTGRFPDGMADITGIDFDYDSVSSMSYELDNKGRIATEITPTQILKQHIKNIAAYQNRLLGLLEETYSNEENFKTLTTGINMNAYKNLANRNRYLVDNSIPYNFSTMVKITEENSKSRNLVGLVANDQKAYSLLMYAAQVIESNGGKVNGGITPVLINNRTDKVDGESFGDNVIMMFGNRINVVIDNGAYHTMNAIGLNSMSSPMHAVAIATGRPYWLNRENQRAARQAGEIGGVINFLKKYYIQSFLVRAEKNYDLSNNNYERFFVALDKEINKNKEALRKLQESGFNENMSEVLDMLDLTDYTDDIYRGYREEYNNIKAQIEAIDSGADTNLSFVQMLQQEADAKLKKEGKKKIRSNKELKRESKEEKQNKAKMLKDLYKQLDDVREKLKQYSVIDRLKDFEKLRDLAVEGESWRRWASIVAYNQGLEVNNASLYMDKAKLEFYLGSRLEDFNAGRGSSYNYMDWYAGLSDEELAVMKDIEDRIRGLSTGGKEVYPGGIDLKQMINAIPQLKEQLKSFELAENVKEMAFNSMRPIVDEIHANIIGLTGVSNLKNDKHFYEFNEESNNFIRDLFYENRYFQKNENANADKFEFVRQLNEFLKDINSDYAFNYNGDYSIAGEFRSKVFVSQVMGLVKWINENADNTSPDINIEALKNNSLVKNLQVSFDKTSEYIKAVASDSTDENIQGLLQDGFKNLDNPKAENEKDRTVRVTVKGKTYDFGKFFQEALRHYQFIQYGFRVQRGSLANIVDTKLIEEFSSFSTELSNALESKSEIQFLGTYKPVLEVLRNGSMQILAATPNIVSITEGKSNKMDESQRPVFAAQFKNGRKMTMMQDASDERKPYIPVMNKNSRIGVRYSSRTMNGFPTSITTRTYGTMKGAESEAFMRLAKGQEATLNFKKVINYDVEGRRIWVDGIEVEVLDKFATSIRVRPVRSAIELDESLKAILTSQQKNELDQQTKEEEEKKNDCINPK